MAFGSIGVLAVWLFTLRQCYQGITFKIKIAYLYSGSKYRRFLEVAYLCVTVIVPPTSNESCLCQFGKVSMRKFLKSTVMGELYSPELLFALNTWLLLVMLKLRASIP
jgi:hypothetical protein